MDESKVARIAVQIQPTDGPLPPPVRVGFIQAAYVADELQLTLCDVDFAPVAEQVRAWKESGSAEQLTITLDARPMQKLSLSKFAVPPLLQILQAMAGEQGGSE